MILSFAGTRFISPCVCVFCPPGFQLGLSGRIIEEFELVRMGLDGNQLAGDGMSFFAFHLVTSPPAVSGSFSRKFIKLR
jgi:hypothetical protein